MNPQELKQGQSYLILANYDGKDCDNDYVFTAVPAERRLFLNLYAVQTCVSLPSEPPTLVGSQSKHDPRRRFKKGDRVRVVAWQGRSPGCSALLGKITTVLRDEYELGVRIQIGEGESYYEPEACFLELVTPVEDLEPFGIAENIYGWIVFKDTPGNVMANFNNIHPHARKAAEDERDRLNAEYRKNLNND